MAATKVKATPEAKLAQEIVAKVKSEDYPAALALAQQGARDYPDFTVKAGGNVLRFAQLAQWVTGRMAEQDQAAPVEETAPAPEPVEPEPVAVETVTLRLIHNGTDPTSIYGIEKDSPAHRAVGSVKRGGLGWHFWAQGPCFYLPRTGGFAPQDGPIREAIAALEAIRQDDQALYRVETDIRTTDANGEPLPVRMTAKQRADWQRAYTGTLNSINWHLGNGKGVCGGCGVTGLDVKTGRIGKDDDGMPRAECHTCGGFELPTVAEPAPAPVVTVKATAEPAAPLVIDLPQFALAAEPAPVPPAAECGSCRQMIEVVDGQFKLHARSPYGGSACPGKPGRIVTDVEPEPAAQPARKATTRKAQPVAQPAPVAEPVDSDDSDEDAVAAWVVKIAFQPGLSGTARSATATDVRSALNRNITNRGAFRGVEFEGRNMKKDATPHMRIFIDKGAEGVDLDALEAAVVKVVKGVRGMGNRINKG